MSSIRTVITRTVLARKATYHSQIILCLVDAGFLLLVERVAVPGASGADLVKAISADTRFTRSSVAPLPVALCHLSGL